jgi:hypothetical protein
MKSAALLLFALAVPALAGKIEGTVWYDSKGRVAWVEGPAARKEPAREPFVPRWIAYEKRRDRALRGGFTRSGGRHHWCGASGGGWGGAVVFRSWRATAVRCAPAFRGVRVIVR